MLGRAIQSHIKQLRTELFTTLPAKVVAYYPETQTADLQPLVGFVYIDGYKNPMPIVEGCPVYFPTGGGATMTFPVKPNDMAILSFTMLPLDNFSVSDGSKVVYERPVRTHNISDAVAFVGIGTRTNNVSPDPDNVSIKFNEAYIKITPSGEVNIKSSHITADAPTVDFTGNVNIAKNLTVQGNISTPSKVTSPSIVSGGVEMTGHTHPAGGIRDGENRPCSGNSGGAQ